MRSHSWIGALVLEMAGSVAICAVVVVADLVLDGSRRLRPAAGAP